MSAGPEYLTTVISKAMITTGPILECGSGLSTLILGLIAERRRLQVWSLEEDHTYGRDVAMRVSRFQAVPRLLYTPLAEYGDYEWYAVPGHLPADFTLVVCDGPSPKCRGGRYGL